MTDPTTRPLTLSDLWLPGDVLGCALLRGWTGPALVKCIITDDDGNDVWECGICAGGHASNGFRGRDECRLDFTRPEVRDHATRILGPDLLPIHAAELRGEITPGEAAGLVWCSVVRREAGLGVVALPLSVEPDECDPGSLLAAGYSLREPGGILLLPLPGGVIGRLETSND